MLPKEITDFYNKHKKRLYNIALCITGDAFDAEEAVQNTVVRYLRFNNEKLSSEQVEAWLSKTCVRTAIDMMRVRKALKVKLEKYAQEMEEEAQGEDEFWADVLETSEQQAIISKFKACLMKLPDGYRAVLSLLLLEGYDYSEAAQILEVSESTVRSQYLRGKRKLKELWIS